MRTGVTVVVPHDGNVWSDPVYAAYHRLNGNGEMTGLPWLEEVGLLHSPIGITNTHSVGIVRDALVELEVEELPDGVEAWALPVVAETWDGTLNDVDGFHVTAEHAKAAYRAAAPGPVAEGSVGGGTGMMCHDFKGGIGTASPRGPSELHRRRARAGQPRPPRAVQRERRARRARGRARTWCPADRMTDSAAGQRVDHRRRRDRRAAAAAAVPATGRAGVVRRRTHRRGRRELQRRPLHRVRDRQPRHARIDVDSPTVADVRTLANAAMNPLFDAVVEATEEAILNAILASPTMSGRGRAAHALPTDLLLAALAKYGRPATPPATGR